MRRYARRGGARLSAHQKRSPQLHLHSPKVHFDADSGYSLPRAKVSCETAQRTRWAPSAFESNCQACASRCTQLISTNDSAAHRSGAEPSVAQPSEEAANGSRMTIKKLVKLAREWGGPSRRYNPP